VLHRARPRAIAALAEAQQAMLARAADWLKPGGTLVYSVCSLEPEEGEQVVKGFLRHNAAFRLDRSGILPEFVPVASAGWVRILPGILEPEGGLDGFFMARLVRSA
jgi:16S rRNA (cytosine967-C5)-methyltransferase